MNNQMLPFPVSAVLLGSGSPRRKQLLEGVGLDIHVLKKDVDESIIPEITGSAIPMHLAEKKAKAFDGEIGKNQLLITADTIVWMGGEVFGKPADEQEATQMLKTLQGRTHQVFTGVCLTMNGRRHCFHVATDVTFFPLDDTAIINYIRHYQPYDKAGSYGAQEGLPEGMDPLSDKEKRFLQEIGKPSLFRESLAADDTLRVPIISHIQGSYFNVMGLPIAELWDELRHFSGIVR